MVAALMVALVALDAGGGRAPVSAAEPADPVPPQRVLALFPSEPVHPVSVLLEQGLRDTLRAADGGAVTVHTEHLDMARLPEPALQRAQLDWLRRKYADRPPDAVVAFGTSTARALGALGAPLFPGAVAVFAALDPLQLPNVVVPPDADTLWVRHDVGATLGAALRLQPAARRVLLVAGTEDSDRSMLVHARREVAPYAEQVSIEEVTDLSLDELVRRVAALPPETVVLFLTVNRDGAGAPLPVGEALRRVVAVAGAPVYTTVETSIGGGVVGGAVTSYRTLGAEAARAVLRRLADPGAAPDSGAPAAPKLVFDWRQLQRWGLREEWLPPASEVRFKPPSLWEQYRWYVAGALVVIVAQGLLVAGLLVERSHRQRAQTALAERQEELVRVNADLRGRTREVEARNAQVRALAGQLITAQERERALIARELHDEVGQALTIVKINLDTMRSMGDATSPSPLLDEGVALVERALDQVRDLSLLLRPSLLDHLGLEAALRWLVGSQAQRFGYRATFTSARLLPPPSADVAITCYRVAQEALTNVARHSRAQNVSVDLQVADGSLRLTIRDDGDGFDLAAMRLRANQGGSSGLLNLEERAGLANGHLSVTSVPGDGTTLILSLPYAESDLSNGDEARRVGGRSPALAAGHGDYAEPEA
jgi:signal transduction histidine kinase